MADTIGEIVGFETKDEGLRKYLHTLARVCELSITEKGQVKAVNGTSARKRFLGQIPNGMTFKKTPRVY